jgi:hypothetical protein
MKLFKIAQKKTEGQCHAMRCQEPPTEQAMYIDGAEVELCERHAKDLAKYKAANPPTDLQTGTTPAPLAPVGDSLANVLVNNLAIETGAIQSREETAKLVHGHAVNMLVTSVDSRDKADALLKIVHEEEKALKKEVDRMYKPIKDAAKSTRTQLNEWFGPAAVGDHEAAAQCATDASANVNVKNTYQYSVKDFGAVPLEFMIPSPWKTEEIVKLLPLDMLVPNFELIKTLVDKHGLQLEIPGVKITLEEKINMKGGRSK